jgi:amino acid adenylation domain-containing protein
MLHDHLTEGAFRPPEPEVTRPDRGAAEPSLSSGVEPAPPPRAGETLQRIFEAQVEQTPNRVAVSFRERQWTYRELNRRANQVAHHLRGLGVGPDVLVGLFVERSAEMVAGLLGILKAGGAYVPLDPEFPAGRLAFYVQDSAMPVLLTQRRLLERLPAHNARVVCLDDLGAISGCGTDNPGPAAGVDNLAYVIFTSGSTGKPKGVQIPHRALTNFLNAMRREPGPTAVDVLLAVTTLSFDIHVLELWLPLTVGARAVVLSREEARDGLRLAQALHQTGATVLQATPATWRMLVNSGWEGDGRLKALCGGESLTAELAERLLPRVGSLWNLYGPTETTVWSTVHRVRSAGGLIPVGRPIANTYVRLLDADRRPVPAGEPGELYVGGACLARGYLNRPELTAEYFLPDPFGVPGERLYRTGDRGRLLPDGNLEFLGRVDHQVKVHGYRVELGEVEVALCQHPTVREAVVTCPPGEGRLVAYLVADPRQLPAVGELRRFLRDRLPGYMVPAAFVRLDALPLTPSGKVDRIALPASPHERPDTGRTAVPPRTDLERRLAGLWEEILKVRLVGVADSFADLGGDSLQAVDMLLQVRKWLGKEPPALALSRELTVERLAALLNPGDSPESRSILVPLQPHGHKAPLFFVHAISGEASTFTPLVNRLSPDQPFYGFQLPAVGGACIRFPSIEAMAARYVDELLAVRPDGVLLLGGYSLGGAVAFEMARQLTALGRRPALVSVVDEPSPGMRSTGWEPRAAFRFLGNLGPWLVEEIRQNTPAQLAARAGRKLLAVLRRLARRFRPGQGGLVPVDISSWFNSRVPEEFLALCEHNYRSLLAYAPSIYPGAVTFFRARAQPLFGPHEPDLGWERLAAGGVTTHVVPGNHLSILREPQVGALAKILQAALDRAAD